MSEYRILVIGGGVAGLLATLAVARPGTRVTLIERDAAIGADSPRKGAPQGHHVHTLLLSGRDAIEALCPGAYAQLCAAGGHQIDFCADVAFFHYGVWKSRCRSNFIGTLQTRPLLEQLLWRRVRRLPNVQVESGTARRLLVSEDRRRVTGVEVSARDGGVRGHFGALVVDASGRGSRLPDWLAQVGLAAPRAETVSFDLRYASCFCDLPPNPRRDWRALLVYPKAPFGRRAGYIFPVEGNRHLVTLAGYFGESPTADFADFRAFARTLPRRELHDAIADAAPTSRVQLFHLPAQYRRHYDRLSDAPSGLIVIGDALCVLDPLFGQGMSVAACQALELKRCFERSGERPGARGWAALQGRIARQTDVPWLLTSSEAFRYAETGGNRSRLFALLQWYAAQVFALSAHDAEAYRAFMGLMHLVAPLPSVFRPRLVLAALRQAARARCQGVVMPGNVPAASPAN